jgi:hypothetical protein
MRFKINCPIFLSRPDFVVGIPVVLAILFFALVIPSALFQLNENPKFLAIIGVSR